ncbi:hypothetical protein LUW74_20905 [Actinomadura madurae]|nr:hypothetical protein [Actinomadura madurae]URN05530.1 hypothetical protein LUW74_20905 [Actinomadura madurae]
MRGIIRPPATPWTTRKAIRPAASHARALRTDPSRNPPRAEIHRRRPPRRDWAQPASGMAANTASRYAVLTHWTVDRDVCRSVARSSRPTLTMVVSNTTARAPTMRVTAMRRTAGSTRSDSGAGDAAVVSRGTLTGDRL